MIYITRKEHFNAAHKMYNPAWSKEKNETIFGPCANENWHGHNYELFVTIKGDPHPETGYVMDIKELSGLLRENLINKVDHKNLNIDVDFMQGKLASTENFTIEIWRLIQPLIEKKEGVKLHSIKLYETPRNFVEYFGE